MTIVPVVLCGGSGTRLWPLSRKDQAKQHVPILGGESPFQRTLRRLTAIPALGTPLVITGAEGRFMTADQATDTTAAVDLVIEPEGRDTLPAIIAATLIIEARQPDAMLLVLPSDHLIPDTERFAKAMAAGAEAAATGALVTFGIMPTAPATGYGYIRPGEVQTLGHAIAAFEEKPTRERAERLIAEGCLWNAGMFMFRADAGLAEMARLAPEAVAMVRQAVAGASDDLGAVRLGAAFAAADKVSFDYAVMEKTRNGVVIRAEFAWSDIGDWREVWQQSAHDENGVVLEGDAVARDVRNSFVHAGNRLVCALGVENLAIIDTPDALLVTALDRTQEVKALVTELAGAGRSEATTPARVYRPWGWYQTMDLGERFRVKRIQVSPGRKLSLQKHHHRAEHWVVVRGTAEVMRDGQTIIVRENESVYLPLGCVHRLANPGKIPVEIIEVQTGSYLEEDDIVRIEDDFGRF
jgi:mannose-1-phosphate guanylyltransferase/mannose-6-phosphate isomerase